MEIRPIHTEEDYKTALREVSACFDCEPTPGTPDGDRFEVLLTLVEAYEAKHFPVDLPDPVDAIKFRMEQAGIPERPGAGYRSPESCLRSSQPQTPANAQYDLEVA
jgi:antitoxin component HigA of HigAB toxin-antitoxin module